MKNGPIFLLPPLLGLVLSSSIAVAQEKKPEARPLDAFISATTKKVVGEPVPGAEITVEQRQPQVPTRTAGAGAGGVATQPEVVPRSRFVTNDKGKFTFTLTPDQVRKLPDEFHLKFTIRPKDPAKFPAETDSVVVRVKKSDEGVLTFLVTFERPDAKTNKGTFAVNSKART